MRNCVDVIIIGAGDRGNVYGEFAKAHPERMRVVGVAEPRESFRMKMAEEYSIPPENVFTDWTNVVERERFADAVIIATPDALHAEPAIEFAENKYHILLEKPMAPTEEECRRIVDTAINNGIILSVCHVLRYTNYTRTMKTILDSGRIGEIVSIQRLEPLGYWHQVHSFVRGNWKNETESSFMLLAKSCHDIDWIRYIMDQKCRLVSSFGSLFHFRRENKPKNASDNCLDCDYESRCPYSAKKIYFGFLEKGETGWPVNVVTPNPTEDSLLEVLRAGPYGRCVYECDNDVVDHQVVNMEFEGGASASFTMTGFTKERRRETRIFGTCGEIYGDGSKIHIFDFLTDQTEIIDTNATDRLSLEGHSGGDYGIMDSFIQAVSQNDPSRILSGPEITLESHLMVFAAERSRLEKRTIHL